jgi:hypothetical protein
MQIENSGKSNPVLARVTGDSMGSVRQNNAGIVAVFDALPLGVMADANLDETRMAHI